MSILNDDLQFHLKIKKGDIGKYVILPGDPARSAVIAEYFDNPQKIAQNREFTIYTGYLLNEKVSVCSTGIGGPSAAIAIEELINCGADTFIRVGTSGGMASEVVGGDIIIPTGAVRGDGTSKEYLPIEYPAVSDFKLSSALYKTAKTMCNNQLGNSCHIGVVQSKDSFYGETNPETMPINVYLESRWEMYLKAGCLASEMECATLFSIGLARKVQVAAVITAIWNVERTKLGLPNPITHDTSKAINCVIETIKNLIMEPK